MGPARLGLAGRPGAAPLGVHTRKEVGMGACGRLGPTELLLIGLLVVLLFGANRLPEIGRGLGLGIRRFKKAIRDEDGEEKKSLRDDTGSEKS